jgi:hypothetical protein
LRDDDLKGFYRYLEGMLYGAILIVIGGLCIEIKKFFLKNQRPPAEMAPAPSKGHPHSPQLFLAADLAFML